MARFRCILSKSSSQDGKLVYLVHLLHVYRITISIYRFITLLAQGAIKRIKIVRLVWMFFSLFLGHVLLYSKALRRLEVQFRFFSLIKQKSLVVYVVVSCGKNRQQLHESRP